MTAMTVTPEIVRVAFLRRMGKSLRFCFGVKAAIISGLEGTWSRWCLAAVRVLSWFTSCCVGLGRSIKAAMISFTALSKFDVSIQV